MLLLLACPQTEKDLLPLVETGVEADADTDADTDADSDADSDSDADTDVSETAPYEDILDERVGFGRKATGGQGGSVCTVTNTNNSGAGSLRGCVAENTWVRFDVDGDITLTSDIDLPSNLTIDGRGSYVRIYDSGFNLFGVENVILTNLIFKEGNGGDDNDAVQMKDGTHDVWVHHVSFSEYGDGLVDITRQSTDVTVSWCKFSKHRKVMLIGANPDTEEDKVIRVTLHHNWFRETWSRHPRLRYGKVHAFNNWFDAWGEYGMGCIQTGQCYSEANIYEAGDDTDAIVKMYGDSDDKFGKVKSVNDWLLNGATVQENGTVFDPADYYSWTAETADSDLRTRIEENAGWR